MIFLDRRRCNETIDQYLADVAEGKRTRAAAYEVGIQLRDSGNADPQVGDQIRYYIRRGPVSGGPAFESAAPAEEWRAGDPDEDTTYYLKRLDEFAAKFTPFFSDHHYRQVFSEPDLFGFDARSIYIISESVDDNPTEE